jgi:hypothetical protein
MVGNENIQIDLGVETGFDRFVFYNGWNVGMVSDFELLGSNDGSVFSIITQDSGLLADSNLQQPTRREYNFATVSYKSVRMRITRIVQDVTYCAVGLIQLFDTISPPNEGWLIDEGRLLELRSLRPFNPMPIDREIGIPKALWRKIDTQNHGERLVIGWNEDSRLEIFGACANAGQLSEVVFPSTLKQLGRYAFRGTALTNVQVPQGVDYYDTTFPDGVAPPPPNPPFPPPLPHTIMSHTFAEIVSGTVLSLSIRTQIGTTVVAVVTNRWDLTPPTDLELKAQTDPLITPEITQRLSVFMKEATSTTETITINQSQAGRIYIQLFAFAGKVDLQEVQNITQNNISTPANFTATKNQGEIMLYAATATNWTGGNRWSTTPDDISAFLPFDRQNVFYDRGNGALSRTVNAAISENAIGFLQMRVVV